MKKFEPTWDDIEKSIDEIIIQMYNDEWRPSCIIGLTHGGIIPSVIMSNKLNLPLVLNTNDDLSTYNNILVFNDINRSGNVLTQLYDNYPYENNTRIACIVHNEACNVDVDYASMYINTHESLDVITFPWNAT